MHEEYVKIDVNGRCSDNDKSYGNVVFPRHYIYEKTEEATFQNALDRYIKDADLKGLRPVSITMERTIVHHIQK